MRKCTCHPSERLWPCAHRYAASECRARRQQTFWNSVPMIFAAAAIAMLFI